MTHSINLKDFIEKISYNKSQTYNKQEVLDEIAKIELIKIVSELPTTNIKNNKIYLVLNDESIRYNRYDLYIYANGDWEQIDSLEFNIGDYYTSVQINSLLNDKADKGHGHDNATSEIDGFMSMEDKAKLDLITPSTENLPLIDSVTPSIGVSNKYSREDHIHPTIKETISSTASNPISLDSYVNHGFYKISGIATLNVDENLKSKLADYTYGLLEVKNYSLHTFVQFLYTLKKNVVSEIYYRTCYTDTFSAWEKLKPHEHGVINDDGSITNATSKNIVTDANGVITTEAKNNHSHGSMSSAGKITSSITTDNVNKVVVTDSNNSVKVTDKLPLDSVTHQDISGKINYTDVVDNLTSSDTNKPLSAKQGKWLKDNTVQTAGTGLSKTNNTLNHSNNVQAVTSESFKKIKYDTEGHITGSTNVVKSDITGFNLNTGDIKDTNSSNYANLGSLSNNATQKDINGAINTQVGLKANADDVYKKTETMTSTEIATAIANGVSNVELFVLVSSLPTSNIKGNKFYLVPNNESINQNVYDIYIRVNNKWEQIDSLEFNIADYYTRAQTNNLLDKKINYTDTQDNLNSDSTTKPLSANQGKILDGKKFDTAGTGLTSNGTTVNHSNSVTALNTNTLKKIAYDTEGHITSTATPSTADLPNSVKYENIKTGESTTLTLKNQKQINDAINNRLVDATQSSQGLMSSTDKTNLDKLVSPTDTTKNAHTHGYITTDGKVGTNQNYFVYTTTGGLVTSKQKIGQINTDGKIGTESGKPLITTTNGVITTGTFGSNTSASATEFVSCADSRLSDTRTPTDNTVSSQKIQSKAVTTEKLDTSSVTLDKINPNAIDTTPTDGSSNLITSDAVYDSLKSQQSSFATNGHNHSGTYVDGAGTKNTTNGSAIAEIKANTTVKGTIYHPKILSSAVTSGLYKISVNTDGHITATTSVSGTDLPSHNQATTTITNSETYSNLGSNLTNQKLINDAINGKLVTATSSKNGLMSSTDKSNVDKLVSPTDTTKNAHGHGNITTDGKVTATTSNVSRVLVTDGDVVKSISQLPFSKLNITKDNITGLGVHDYDISSIDTDFNLFLGTIIWSDNTNGIWKTNQTANITYENNIRTFTNPTPSDTGATAYLYSNNSQYYTGNWVCEFDMIDTTSTSANGLRLYYGNNGPTKKFSDLGVVNGSHIMITCIDNIINFHIDNHKYNTPLTTTGSTIVGFYISKNSNSVSISNFVIYGV